MSGYLINTVLDKIRDAVSKDESLILSPEETKELAKRIGDISIIPVYSMEQVNDLVNAGVIGKGVGNNVD